jgi:hypothetical protein
MARVVAQGFEIEDPFCDSSQLFTTPRPIRGNANLLYWLLEETHSIFRHQNLEGRVRAALQMCSERWQPDVASLMRGLLGDHQITLALCHIRDDLRRTLLHCISWSLGEQEFISSQIYRAFLNRCPAPATFQTCKDPTQRLLILGSELVAAGSDIHALAYRCSSKVKRIQTPLTAIFQGFSDFHCTRYPLGIRFHYPSYTVLSPEILATLPYPSDVFIPVFHWLTLLKNAGIGLLDYGRKEKLVYNCRYPSFRSPRMTFEGTALPRMAFSFNFSYGSRPEDWKFWLIPMMDNSFTEFWDMVDHPERAMPGYWDDDESEDGSELDF